MRCNPFHHQRTRERPFFIIGTTKGYCAAVASQHQPHVTVVNSPSHQWRGPEVSFWEVGSSVGACRRLRADHSHPAPAAQDAPGTQELGGCSPLVGPDPGTQSAQPTTQSREWRQAARKQHPGPEFPTSGSPPTCLKSGPLRFSRTVQDVSQRHLLGDLHSGRRRGRDRHSGGSDPSPLFG